MVIVCDCSKQYPASKEDKYAPYFEGGPSLSCFQKYAIEAIVEGHHSLICVPTGNGKTLPAEFAIRHFCRSFKKKVIYTSPIKALSNQKYYDFREKYPDISFGLLTGDIKLNPSADVLIMTAEILQNALYSYHTKSVNTSSSLMLSFDMDFENDLACVIHDEVHCIGMPDRGHVWETILMLLPVHVQNVMLSATLDRPEIFAQWCENIHGGMKNVYLTTLEKRIVPLTHYSFITCNEGFFKKCKMGATKTNGNDELEKQIRPMINTPIEIYKNGKYNEVNYRRIVKVLTALKQKDPTTKISRPFVLNQVCRYLVENHMLPCACFILSRKHLERAAREVTVPLLEDDSKTPYIIRKRCESLLRDKLTNYQEFLDLPEYNSMIALLEKGIATHHSGIIPILKEVVEMLFVEGYIKLLFCTETFSCGLNMPIKTTIFTDLQKFDGKQFRLLYGYEYNQASGRAGRRGIDKEGYVIHLNNLFKGDPISVADYSNMLLGRPQRLMSQYKISSYQLLLSTLEKTQSTLEKTQSTLEKTQSTLEKTQSTLEKTQSTLEKITNKSMYQQELDYELIIQDRDYQNKAKECTFLNTTISNLKTPMSQMEMYLSLTTILKKKKDIERQIRNIKETYYSVEEDCKILVRLKNAEQDLHKLAKYKDTTTNYVSNKIAKTVFFLEKRFYIHDNKLLVKGSLAKCFKEVPCLLFSELVYHKHLSSLTDNKLASLLSCFTATIVSNENRCNTLQIKDDIEMDKIITIIQCEIDEIRSYEEENYLETGESYDIHYDLMEYIVKWMEAETSEDCKWILQQLEEKDIFLGEFTKAVLKIIAITNELVTAGQQIEDFVLVKKAQNIAKGLQKYIVTNQSLYI
jgi:superfamily II RNA helicase